jgi:hypothetical protein
MSRSTFFRSAAGILLAAGTFELFLRHLSWTEKLSPSDPGPSVTIHRLNEGWGLSRWDRRGFRISAGAQGPVVLAVGDSFTEALQVNDEAVFTARVEALAGVRVLNVGRGSESPADYCALAQEYRSRFRPAWTVIEINAADFMDDAFQSSKAHFVVRQGHLVPQQPEPGHPGRISRILAEIRARSALVNYGIARLDMFSSASQAPPLFRAADREKPRQTAGPPHNWPVEEELAQMSAAYEERVTFLLIPDFEPSRTSIEERFLAHCQAATLSCVDLRAAFGEFTGRGSAPFGFPNSRFGQGHLNREGHRAAALLLAHEILELRRRGLF